MSEERKSTEEEGQKTPKNSFFSSKFLNFSFFFSLSLSTLLQPFKKLQSSKTTLQTPEEQQQQKQQQKQSSRWRRQREREKRRGVIDREGIKRNIIFIIKNQNRKTFNEYDNE